jgi:outer membrane protein assembly factor BamB
VILPTTTGLIGLRARDGSEAWRYTLPGGASVESGLHVWPVEKQLYIQAGTALICLRSSDGKEVWTISPGGWVYDLRVVDSMLVLGGETHETLLDQLNKGPLLTPGADIMRTVVAKEMPKADVAKPFTVVINPAGPELVCAVKTGGAATVVGDRLIVAQTRFQLAFNDTSGGGTTSTSTLTGYDLDNGKISWQTKLEGSLSDVRFIGDMMYAVFTKEEKSSLVAIHLD